MSIVLKLRSPNLVMIRISFLIPRDELDLFQKSFIGITVLWASVMTVGQQIVQDCKLLASLWLEYSRLRYFHSLFSYSFSDFCSIVTSSESPVLSLQSETAPPLTYFLNISHYLTHTYILICCLSPSNFNISFIRTRIFVFTLASPVARTVLGIIDTQIFVAERMNGISLYCGKFVVFILVKPCVLEIKCADGKVANLL